MRRPNSYDCPRCHSDRTSTIAVAYSTGRTLTSSASIHVGGILDEDDFMAALGISSSDGEHVTEFAASIAPPAERELGQPAWVIAACYGFGGILGLFAIIGALNADDGPTAVGIATTLGILASLLVIAAVAMARSKRSAMVWNKTTWPILYKRWAAQWVCSRCGSVFVPRDKEL